MILIGLFPFIRVMQKVWSKNKELWKSTDKDKIWYMKWILQIVICIVGLVLMLKVIRVSWVVPPNYDVVGKSWLDIFYEMLEFYLLSGIKLNNMQFLNRWNILSIFCLVICGIGIVHCRMVTEKSRSARP